MNTYGANLYIDFSPEEVTNFLIANGYEIKKVTGVGKKRKVVGMEGGEVQLSDYFESTIEIEVAVKLGDMTSDEELIEENYENRPDYVFKKVLKNKLLNLK